MPLGHLGINVGDLDRARAYYDDLMPMLDFEPFVAGEDEFSYRPANDKPGTWIFFYRALDSAQYSRHQPGLQHLAFMVRTRGAVHNAHQWAVDRGATVVHGPREFPEYHPGYYATFWLDPDGILLEVVCHRHEGQ